MSFYLFANESVEAGVKRVVNEQIAQAIAEIDDPKLERSEAVHQVRKRCKKARAVLRIVRPQFEETYQLENVWFRDTAKGLAKLRDSKAVIETYDSLVGNYSDQIDRRAFASVRRALTLRRKKIIQETEDFDQQLDEIRARLNKAAERVVDWNLKTDGFEGIEEGFVAIYRRARKAMPAAYDHSTAENFHEWRKQVKYHNYHVRLLRELWKPVMRALRGETDELSDLLGDDHNLYVFHQTLVESFNAYGGKRDIQALLGLIDRRSAELRMEAKTIGTRIFAQKPKAFANRFRVYGNTWRSEVELPSKKLREEPATVTG